MKTSNPRPKKLLEELREQLRTRHYALRTETTYISWVRKYILFHNKRHPKNMGPKEINAFLTHLAIEKNVASTTQNQALSAILFLYRYLLNIELPKNKLIYSRPKKRKYIPTVLSREEAKIILQHMDGVYLLMAQIMYGSGLRLMEVLRLRVKDLDFANRQTIVRDGKGGDDRITTFPDLLMEPLRLHLNGLRYPRWGGRRNAVQLEKC